MCFKYLIFTIYLFIIENDAQMYSNMTRNATAIRVDDKETSALELGERPLEDPDYLHSYAITSHELFKDKHARRKPAQIKNIKVKSDEEDFGSPSREMVLKSRSRKPSAVDTALELHPDTRLDPRREGRRREGHRREEVVIHHDEHPDEHQDSRKLPDDEEPFNHARREMGIVEGRRRLPHERGVGARKGCVLKIKKDFGEPSPVYVYNGKLLDMREKGGQIRIRNHENITVSCPGKGRLLVFDANIFKENEAHAHCLYKNKFQVGKYWKGKFRHIECNSNVRAAIYKSKERCGIPPHNTHTNIYRVGFTVAKEFHQLYHGCFDRELGTTLYMHHKITPRTKHRQNGGRRPYYTRERETFENIRIANAYHVPLQRRVVNTILGRDTLGKYINEDHFLARTQLAPRLDFIMRTEQRAAYTYLNTVPQWKHIKEGDWARLEEGLRLRAQEVNSTLRVWSGTYGIWTAPGREHREYQMFLVKHRDGEHMKSKVPVPMYIYKLVYLRCEEKATAFVSVNLPPRTSEYDLQSKVFCVDICKNNRKFHWLKWKHHNSLSFCCDYFEFTKKVPTNIFPLEVNEIFH